MRATGPSSRATGRSWIALAIVLLAGCTSAPTCPQPPAQLLIPPRPEFLRQIDEILGISSPSAATTPRNSER